MSDQGIEEKPTGNEEVDKQVVRFYCYVFASMI